MCFKEIKINKGNARITLNEQEKDKVSPQRLISLQDNEVLINIYLKLTRTFFCIYL